jgi:mannose-6-phosphate isomerase-like protein (cupin superfamily)
MLADSDGMTVHIHCYAPKGGENGLHAHTDEDHVFICLRGGALFRGLKGEPMPLGENQAIFLQRGCFYSFSNEAEEACVLVRIGAGSKGHGGARIDPEGKPIPGRSKMKDAVTPVLIEGAFFPG